MEPITTAAIAAALGAGLVQVGHKLIEKGIVEPTLEPATDRLKNFAQRGYRQTEQAAKADQALLNAVETALQAIDAPTDDIDKFQAFARNMGLINLTTQKSPALRRQVAQAVITFTDPTADPPESLMVALRWPPQHKDQLVKLLTTLRAELYKLEAWQAPLEYANQVEALGRLQEMATHLARLDTVFVNDAIRVALVDRGLSETEFADIQTRYREELVRDLKMHDFRGIVQMRKDIRLPLADIYQELGLLTVGGGDEERRRVREQLLAMREAERLAVDEQRWQNRVSDALAQAQRLVILGEPGAGKTISLRFITLMLAYGDSGAARLGLAAPYIPLSVRLADFARSVEENPALSLDNFLLQVVEQEHTLPKLAEFMRLALEKGACMILLDGLDEVGDDPVRGQSLREQVVKKVQTFADRWCSDPQDRPNRLVITSRIEGYWNDPLRGVEHVQLSPLQPPDEVREFLLRWYTAHEQAHDPSLSAKVAQAQAERRVAELLPCILEWPSVRRLATNPLLLTILALIHENVGKLPNRRIQLYEICAQTLIESWRQAQTGMPSELLADLGEETVIRVMAPLAYWLHENYPGGTAAFEEWHTRLIDLLTQEGLEEEAREIANRFLHHARYEAGLLAERSLGQYGFFHLTFEEYLAAREIARQRAEERRVMLKAHWEDPRWHEVILLAAGQLGIREARRDDVTDFMQDLLDMEPTDPANAGRQVVLAGRALADIGPRSVTPGAKRAVINALRETMQDLNPDTQRPHDPPQLLSRTRYDAGETLDELGWLPPDLNAWLRCKGCADDGRDLLAMKYPVTNAQFERFVLAGGYENLAYWGGEKGEMWQWRLQEDLGWGRKGPAIQPEYWQNTRFGRERQGYPVVGVSWYEATAYAAWLTELLEQARSGKIEPPENQDLVADLLKIGATTVRLPTETEWEKVAGGAAKERYPWDPPAGPATRDKAAILARANTKEAELEGNSPVGMYPLGVSQPFGLMDLGGNVWEWTTTWEDPFYILRGGAWYWEMDLARSGSRYRYFPHYGDHSNGFRLVSPVGSGF
jgi:formylglycine-generating enzyme required for sulfatase activity